MAEPLLQETVDDEIRGRTFATLYTLSRLCMLITLSLAPSARGSSTMSPTPWSTATSTSPALP